MTKLARALNSSDLTHEIFECDPDVLAAAGLTGLNKGLGMLILEAREGCAGDGPHAVARIKDLERALEARVKRIARRWSVRVNARGVAVQVAKELVLDRCMHCQGRGFIPMKYDGTRLIAVNSEDDSARDVDCTVCFGSGAARRDYDARTKAAGWNDYGQRLSEWWEALLQSCCDAEISARGSMWRKLRESRI